MLSTERKARISNGLRDRWLQGEYRTRYRPRLPEMTQEQRREYQNLAYRMGIPREDALAHVFAPQPAREKAPMICECCQRRLAEAPVYTCGELELDTGRRELRIDGRIAKLSPQQMAFLELLMSVPGKIFATHQIHYAISCDSGPALVRVQAYRLRRRLGRYGTMIQYVEPFGYRIAEHALESAAA